MKWEPKDIIAIIMILGAFVLRSLGINHVTEWIIVGVGGSYFGHDILRQYIQPRQPPKE